MDWWRNKNVPECSKVRILGLVRKNSYRGTSPCSVPKVAFWKNGEKSLREVLFYRWKLLYRVRAFVTSLYCCVVSVFSLVVRGCSWLLLVVPGRVSPYLKRFVLGWLRAGGGIYPLHA